MLVLVYLIIFCSVLLLPLGSLFFSNERDREEGVDPEGRRGGTGKSSRRRDFNNESFKMYLSQEEF